MIHYLFNINESTKQDNGKDMYITFKSAFLTRRAISSRMRDANKEES